MRGTEPVPSVDLSPRTVETRGRSKGRLALRIVPVVLILGGIVFVLFQGLGDAALFFRNADEAVVQRESLGDRRFRLQGAVVPGSVTESGNEVDFEVTYNGVEVAVRHLGDPPEMFRDGIPVVLEGRFDGDVFRSDRMLVKHSEVYVADNPDRVDDYDKSPAGSDRPEP